MKTKISTTWKTWEDMPLDEFARRAEKVKKAASDFRTMVDDELPGLVTLTQEQRRFAPKLRVGEHSMLGRVLDVADLKPALFESIADQDQGHDPSKFETGLLRERVAKHLKFGEITAELAPVATHVSDSSHYLAGQFRDAISAAYRIAKTHAMTDKQVNDILAPVIDFMRKSSQPRKSKTAKPEAK